MAGPTFRLGPPDDRRSWGICGGRLAGKHGCDLTLAETATRLKVGGYGRVAWATYQVRTAMQADAALRRRVHRVEQGLNQPTT